MRILVTGGCGFVGANLVRGLLAEGHDVAVVDNLSGGNREYLDGLPLDFAVGDVREPDAWAHLLKGTDAVIHLAAQTRVPDSVANPTYDFDVNVGGTYAVLSAAREYSVSRFIFASSNAPLGRQIPPVREDRAPLPISPYGASKLAGEAYCLAFYGSYGMHTVALRFANLYGPYADHKESVVAKFFSDAFRTGKLTIFGDGNQTRDFIFVDDLVRGIVLALTCDAAAGEVIQLATGIETPVNDLARLVRHLVPHEVDIVHEGVRKGDIYRNYSDISKARKLLGFNPEVSLEEGVRQTFGWFQKAYQ